MKLTNSKTPKSSHPKQSPQNRAPLKVALAVGGAAAAAIAVLVAALVALAWRASRVLPGRPGSQGGRGHKGRWQDRVIDLGDLLPLILLLALVAVLFVALVAWWSTRKANEPLEQALEIQKAFVADASHELRTPLTTLNSRIQLAQHRQAEGGDVTAALEDLRKDADAMNAVLSDLLVAAEMSRVSQSQAPCDGGACCQEALRLCSPAAEQKGITLLLQETPDLWVLADQTAVVRALVALLDNAIRYSPKGGQVLLSLSAPPGSKTAEFRVSDQGPGISGPDPEPLFARFVRGNSPDPGNTRTGNVGLGLALVRDVASRFSGAALVEATGAQGTTFLLQLPLSQAPAKG